MKEIDMAELGGQRFDWADRSNFNRASALIVGRRVVEIIDDLPTEDPGWSSHGGITLVFEDGGRLDIGAWGNDAWGPTLVYTPPEVAAGKEPA